ncbi:hypothetical protein [uncultured Methanoregula sp.]|uniref:hypothetical protein n=1 Tax=uncultured Methanoregula sp. TaxID=1005933 RepID=UPI002AAACF48|nr:hypothetical protein [uncultured Methanoregula sp.]
MDNRVIPVGCLCLILICLIVVPTVCAIVENIEVPASKDPLERDSPANIAALKLHAAYIGASQHARMDGVISYIDGIGGSDGAERLRQAEDDYMAAASSIPVVQTADQINDLRDDMHVQSRMFEEETHARLLFFNGTAEGMQASVNISVNAFDLSLKGMTDPLWLSEAGARIIVFDRESRERNYTMRTLAETGVDITRAQQISGRIDALRPKLEAVVLGSRDRTIFTINSDIKSLNRMYRNTIAEYRAGPRYL